MESKQIVVDRSKEVAFGSQQVPVNKGDLLTYEGIRLVAITSDNPTWRDPESKSDE